jgi:hypothetical protein
MTTARNRLSLADLASKIEALQRLPDDAWLPPPLAIEALDALGKPTTETSLRTWRTTRPSYPPFRKSGGSVAYRLADLKVFAAGGSF